MPSALKKVTLLFLVSLAISGVLLTAYYWQVSGPLKEPIAKHATALRSDAIPPANAIDIYHDDWTRVTHFETTAAEIMFVVGTLFELLVAWVLIAGGVSRAIVTWLEKWVPNVHPVRALYLVIFTLLATIVNIPGDVTGYLIGILDGTSSSTLLLFTYDYAVGFGLTLVGVVLVYVVFYWIMDYFPRRWWVVIAAFMSLLTVNAVFFGPVFFDPLFNTYAPLTDTTLRQEIIALADKAGVPTDRIYVEDTSTRTLESNASVRGLWGTERIVLNDNMLKHYTNREILFVVGHELGHYVHRDFVGGLISGVIEIFLSYLILAFVLRSLVRRFGRKIGVQRENSIVLFPLIGVVLAMFSLAASPINSAVSRIYEHNADAYALQITHDPSAGTDGFKKSAYETFTDPNPPAVLQFWFGDHPTIKERIDFLGEKGR